MKVIKRLVVNAKFYIAILMVIGVAIPFLIKDPYHMHVLIMILIWAILASSLNLILGYTGQGNCCHAAFFGIGAYASALLTKEVCLSFWLALPLSGLISGLFGLVIGFPSLLTRGMYFFIATLGFGIIVWELFVNWVSLTNGPLGIVGIPPPSIGGHWLLPTFTFSTKFSYYFLVFSILLFTIFVLKRLTNSRFGRALTSIRDDEDLAECLGLNCMRLKVISFIISAFFAGIAGSLYAHYILFVSPDTFSYMNSFEIIVLVVVGGMGTLTGPIAGAAILTSISELLLATAKYRMIIYGFFLLFVIVYTPQGIVGSLKNLYTSLFYKEMIK